MTQFPKLIVVEGGEFTGKSTLVKELAAQLKTLGHRVVTYGSPNNFLPLGKVVRKHLLSVNGTPCDEIPLGFAMAGAIRELAQYITDNHLSFEGREAPVPVDYIILDRWYYTTLVYNNIGMVGEVMRRDCLGMAIEGAFECITPAGLSGIGRYELGDIHHDLYEFFGEPTSVVLLTGAEVAFARASESREGEVHHNDLKPLSQFVAWAERYEELSEHSSSLWIDVEIGNRIEEITSQVLQELIDAKIVPLNIAGGMENPAG